ncbi:MAG: DNA-processing protein DprA [Candidatus Paceibacterota bacterium]
MLNEAAYYNALALASKGIYSTIKKFKDQHETFEQAFTNHPRAREIDAQKEWQKLQDSHISLCLASEENFPAQLKEIPWQPHALYYKGSLEKLEKSLAIVGTRKASRVGLHFATLAAKELSPALTIVSGLALGLDTAAHEGALKGGGKTVAVLAGGLDKVYPAQNSRLAEQMLKNGGALISEYPIGVRPRKNFFIERNRIVSGLSKATLVIECPAKSGAKATARFALEQNRDVLVVPGSIADKNYEGSNLLIKEGATLIASVSDLKEELGVEAVKQMQLFDKVEGEKALLLKALQEYPQGAQVQTLCESTGLSAQTVQSELTELLLEEVVTEKSGKYLLII